MLLGWGMERAAREGKDVYLSATDAGKPLYLVNGFEDIGVMEMPGVVQTSMILRAKPT
jgi:hypothetical protein